MHDYLMTLFHADESKWVPLPGRGGKREVESERKRVCPKVLHFVLLVSSMCALRKYVIAHR